MDKQDFGSKVVSIEEYRKWKQAQKTDHTDPAESESKLEPETRQASTPASPETGVA